MMALSSPVLLLETGAPTKNGDVSSTLTGPYACADVLNICCEPPSCQAGFGSPAFRARTIRVNMQGPWRSSLFVGGVSDQVASKGLVEFLRLGFINVVIVLDRSGRQLGVLRLT